MAFANVTKENVQQLIQQKDSKNTKRSISRAVNLFRDYLRSKGKSVDFESYEKNALDEEMSLFYASVRKRNGDFMKKSSVTNLKYGLYRHLKSTKKIDMKKDESFSSSNEAFSAVMTDLKKKGYGAVDHKPPISKDDRRKLFSPTNLAININTPTGLLNKVWLDIMIYLCRRGRENLRDMTRDTFTVDKDSNGRRYIKQVQDENDKNHTETDDPNDTIGEGCMYERAGDPLCPVNSYIKYLSKLNPNNDALWQQPKISFCDEDPVWYTSVPCGKNTLGSMMAKISELSHLSRTYTNHSLRATSIKEMDDSGIEARHIIRVSGHKTESSIKSYSCRLSDEKKAQISDCLGKSLCGNNDYSVSTSVLRVKSSERNVSSTIASSGSNQNANTADDMSLIDFLTDVDFNDNFELEELNVESNVINRTTETKTDTTNTIVSNESNPSYPTLQFGNMTNFMGQLSENSNHIVNPYITNCTVNFNFYTK